ncbi:ANF_receptor domain-containing protein [Meloidogyne graminicola]|uniref:ANF_receptor domain-containing protein n=1 Tax=Meloidogyne graminicola TaxID=189291 RepID=A0A8S9ZX99_9BILA|nr:ANF_receptor domain-containing protein [Meloidogyne graminicola]
MLLLLLLIFLIFQTIIGIDNYNNLLFPLLGALFLPNDVEIEQYERKDEIIERHLATIHSVAPIIDIAIEDAYYRFLFKWTNNPKWLLIGQTKPILQCHEQRAAAWAALESLQWNNNNGINIAFGPACDYLVATIMRILSYKQIPIITNSHSSEFFKEEKNTTLLTQFGPLQDHSIQLIEFLFHRINWKQARIFYEKQFWQNELNEAGSCRLFSSAIEEVYRRQLVPKNSLQIHFEDSQLSDAHGPNVAINQLVNNKLDCIIGYAFVYALAPVARMSPYWKDKDSYGIPVITSVGLTSNLDNRREYQLMTRISSPYKVVKNAVIALFSVMNWIRSTYLFHEQRHDAANPSIPYGECYLLMASIQPHLYRINRMEHNYFMFNELNYNHQRIKENLVKGKLYF